MTLRHRDAQQTLRVATIRELTAMWRSTFDVSDVARSWGVFANSALPVISEQRRMSAALAGDHFSEFRAVAGPGAMQAVRRGDLDAARARRALEYSAKISTLRAIQVGRTPTEAARTGMVRTLGTSTRLVSEGGRQTLTEAVEVDPMARGWQRVTGDDPCEFCAMLSARGGVYRAATSAFEAHDHCGCEAEPIYSSQRYLSPQQEELKELYDRYAKGKRDPLQAFRAAKAREQQAA